MDGKNTDLPDQIEMQENKRKRRHSFSEQHEVEEKIENGAPENKFRLIQLEQFRLLDFSDEVLFEIFKYLDTWSLMALMTCCTRLSSLILDHRFWNYIDLSKEPLPLGILEDVLERSQCNTKCIKLHGPPIAQHIEREDKQFSQTLAKSFANCCKNLQILELQGITIDFRYVKITDFPANLKKLILNNCNVRFEGEKSIFFGIDTHLTTLEELAIENSDWFEPYYMMVFSKVPELRSLSLKGCQLLSDFVPYGSMAARFGFRKLEYLDLRFTPISDSDLQCFNAVTTLKEVLLDCPEHLRENNTETAQDTRVKIRNCYCHSRPNAEVNSATVDVNNDSSPSTSTASRLRITVSISPGTNDSGASTSAAAAAQQATGSQGQQEQATGAAAAPPRDEESSLSSCSSSPSASSSSSNELLAPFLGNPPRAAPLNPIELPLPGGNAPPFSRFLPRPDQIILLDLNNRWRRVVMQNVPVQRENNGDEQQPAQAQAQEQAEQAEQPVPYLYQDQQMLHHQIIEIQQRQNRNQNNNNNNNNNNENNNGNANQIEQVVNHPLFWNMINPIANVRLARHLFRGGDEDGGEHMGENRRLFEYRRSQCSGQYHQYHRHRHRSHHHPISDRGICCFGRPRNQVEHGIVWIRINNRPVGNRPSENRFERMSIRNYKLVTDVSLQHLVQCSPYLVYLDLSGTSVTQRGIDAFKERKPECTVIAEHLIDTLNESVASPKPSCNGDCHEE